MRSYTFPMRWCCIILALLFASCSAAMEQSRLEGQRCREDPIWCSVWQAEMNVEAQGMARNLAGIAQPHYYPVQRNVIIVP